MASILERRYMTARFLLRYLTSSVFLLEICIPIFVHGIITIGPKNREVMVGESTHFNCSTSVHDKNVDWFFYPVGGTGLDRKYVFAFGKLFKPYDEKVRIENSSIGVCNLIILSATPGDAGMYVCQDDGGIGEMKTAQLVVLDSYPSCHGMNNTVVGPNSCGIEPDDLTLSCSVTYHGNIPPEMAWKSNKDNESLIQNTTFENAGNRITYNLTMKADLQMNGSFFFCETTKSTSSQYNCTSALVDVLYIFSDNLTANASVDDQLVCSANKSENLECQYKWKWFQSDLSTREWLSATLMPAETGRYRCDATCNINGRACDIRVMEAYVTEKIGSSVLISAVLPAASTLTSLCVIAIIIGVYMCFRKGKHKSLKEDPEKGGLDYSLGLPVFRTSSQSSKESTDSKDATKTTEDNIMAANHEMESPWSTLIVRYREFLVKHIEPDFGLIEQLSASDALSDIDKVEIEAEKTVYKRNYKLLERIQAARKYIEFNKALTDSEQTHVINYLESDGTHQVDDENWPLLDRERLILRVNEEALIDLLDTQKLQLYSEGVISRSQEEFIYSKSTSTEKNRALLDILSRRSTRDFKKMITCLHESEQRHIANVLEKGGVVVKVHAKLPNERIEEEIISQVVTLLENTFSEESRRILGKELVIIEVLKCESIVLYIYCQTIVELLDLQEVQISGKLKTVLQELFMKILLLANQNRIKSDSENLDNVLEPLMHYHLEEMTVTIDENLEKVHRICIGELVQVRAVFDFDPTDIDLMDRDDFFEFASINQDHVAVSNMLNEKYLAFRRGDGMQIIQEGYPCNTERWWIARDLRCGDIGFIPRNCVVIDYDGCDKFKEESSSVLPTSKIQINGLPLELIDDIILKSYLLLTVKKDQTHTLVHKKIVAQLRWIYQCWSERTRRLKKYAWRRLKGFYSKGDDLHSQMDRCNRQYIEENIQLTSIIKQLKSYDFITDVIAKLLVRNNINRREAKIRKRNNAPDMLNIIRCWDKNRRSNFIQCLLKTNQKHVAEVLDYGGGVVKGEIRNLYQRPSDVPLYTHKQSYNGDEMYRRVKMNNVEILNSVEDRDTNVSIWIRSKNYLEELQKPKTISDLSDVLRSSKDIPLDVFVNIDSFQFEREVGWFPCTYEFHARIRLWRHRSHFINAVTKLEDKIYVLCTIEGNFTSILVFEDGDRFRLEKNISTSEIGYEDKCRSLLDIASNKTESCLYLPDEKCVLKIPVGKENLKIIKWLEIGESGQIINSGHFSNDKKLLIVSEYGTDYHLDVYMQQGLPSGCVIRILSIRLPHFIEHPNRVVETSNGNFIISHRWSKGKDEEETSVAKFIISNMRCKGKDKRKAILWTLSEISKDGSTVIRSFIPENENQQLYDIKYFSIDSYNRVFILDSKRNSRPIVLLSHDLKWNGMIVSEHFEDDFKKGHHLPFTFHYDENKKQMIIGDYYGYLNIYARDAKGNSFIGKKKTYYAYNIADH